MRRFNIMAVLAAAGMIAERPPNVVYDEMRETQRRRYRPRLSPARHNYPDVAQEMRDQRRERKLLSCIRRGEVITEESARWLRERVR